MTTAECGDPRQNHLLDALWPSDAGWLATRLEPVTLHLGDMLYEPGESLTHAWFPTTAIVSLHYMTSSGGSCETSGVGNEGVVGFPLFMGGESTSSAAVVQTAGRAYRLPRHMLKEAFDRAGPMRHVVLRHTQALMIQMTQTAVCNRHHSIDQNLCRWLLSTLDRMPSGELVMTQELIAGMLGVRREGITDAAGKLQHAGLIRYRRGHISVLDRGGLELQACECHAVVKKEMARLLGDVLRPPAAA